MSGSASRPNPPLFNRHIGLSIGATLEVRKKTPLDLLKIDTDTAPTASRLIVAPAQASERRKRFDAAQEWTHKRYGKTFKKLAP